MPPSDPASDLAARVEPARLHSAGAQAPAPILREVAIETPVEIAVAGAPYAVMMASPADLEDFALGFAFTEAIVDDPREVVAIEARQEGEAARVSLTLAPRALATHLARKRAVTRVMAGRTGCGLCGIEDLERLPRAARVAPSPAPAPKAVAAALGALHDAQPLNALTRAAHAAAWCDPSGRILLAREDVGRHNALDKLIGALLRAQVDPRGGFIVVTSRCSYEMVVKAARFGVATLVAVSAPTTLALETARKAGLRVLAIARRESFLAFEPDEASSTQSSGAAA